MIGRHPKYLSNQIKNMRRPVFSRTDRACRRSGRTSMHAIDCAAVEHQRVRNLLAAKMSSSEKLRLHIAGIINGFFSPAVPGSADVFIVGQSRSGPRGRPPLK
jgi:hypothetical protein